MFLKPPTEEEASLNMLRPAGSGASDLRSVMPCANLRARFYNLVVIGVASNIRTFIPVNESISSSTFRRAFAARMPTSQTAAPRYQGTQELVTISFQHLNLFKDNNSLRKKPPFKDLIYILPAITCAKSDGCDNFLLW